MSPILKEKSLELASKLKQQIEKLVEYQEKAPKIEIDIVKENLRELYDIVDGFNSEKVNNVEEVEVLSPNNEEKIDKEIETLLNDAEQQFAEKVDKKEGKKESIAPELFLNEKEALEKNIKNTEENHNKVLMPKPEPEVEMPIQKEEDIVKPPVQLEEPAKRKVHVLEVMPEEESVEEEENLMNSKIKLKSISSLKNGIGINDKFMIINDLFEGHTKQYNKAIQDLDSQENIQSALYLLSDMKDENLWEVNDAAFQQFRTYVERRYM